MVIFKSYFRPAGLQSMLLERKDLIDLRGVQEGSEKKGDPKNEGMSNDVYENKGPMKSHFAMSHDVDENKGVIVYSNDLDEKKGTYGFWGLGAGDWRLAK
jgi:hypothetical protein